MKVIVHPLLPTGNYLNCRIGVERDYPDDFSLAQAINIEWDNLIAIHMKRYPHLYNEKGEPLYEKAPQEDEMKGTHVRDVVPDSNLSPTERMIKAIQACTELDGADGLLSFERLSNTNAEIKAVYDLQLLKLKKIASW